MFGCLLAAVVEGPSPRSDAQFIAPENWHGGPGIGRASLAIQTSWIVKARCRKRPTRKACKAAFVKFEGRSLANRAMIAGQAARLDRRTGEID
jgi:hypothetical protein